jgi:hypothetical protein
VILVLVVLAFCAGGLYYATQRVPDFYVEALENTPAAEQQREQSDALERDALRLHNESGHVGDWEAVFTDTQLNAWLAVDLPEKHGNALPNGISEPRVKITAERVMIAFQYEQEGVSTVVSVAAELYLTDTPNQLAVRILGVHAGWLPVPLKRYLDEMSERTRAQGIPVFWTQEREDPVALVQLPTDHPDFANRGVELKSVELREGEIRFAGRTEWVDHTTD